MSETDDDRESMLFRTLGKQALVRRRRDFGSRIVSWPPFFDDPTTAHAAGNCRLTFGHVVFREEFQCRLVILLVPTLIRA
jgi:hypothetical protein